MAEGVVQAFAMKNLFLKVALTAATVVAEAQYTSEQAHTTTR